MVVTDLDGTLLDGHSRLSERNRRMLDRLGRAGVVRVLATGRNLYSARRVIDEEFPIDYLIFSSGAAIAAWPSGEMLRAHHMASHQARLAAGVLMELGLDFMLHAPVPENHRFFYWRAGQPNPDFERRYQRYVEYAREWPDPLPENLQASQLLAIEPADTPSRQDELERRLPGLEVIRATSPLDHASALAGDFSTGSREGARGGVGPQPRRGRAGPGGGRRQRLQRRGYARVGRQSLRDGERAARASFAAPHRREPRRGRIQRSDRSMAGGA